MTHQRTLSLLVLGALFSLVGPGCSSDEGAPATPGTGCGDGSLLCDGACVNVTASPLHCGACGNSCGPGLACIGGACACAAGTTSCGTSCVNTAQDPANCGSCGNACQGSATCQNGVCTCGTGTVQCGAACVDLQGDGANCGACGALCAAPAVCSGGICSTTGCTVAGTTQCGTSCVDTTSDELNCGGCARACGVGQTCTNGSCGCTAPQTNCSGVCRDLTADSGNCGACGNACGSGQICQSSTCVCAVTGQAVCGGTCTTLATDSANCGACGNACAFGQTCQGGVCMGGGTGGAPGAGGTPGTGGAPGAGGTPGTGGAPGAGGTPGTGGGAASGCPDVSFTISSTLSDTISTVATVSWSVNTSVDSAYIDFGRDPNAWEYRAPVDSPSQSGNQTMLLGMKPDTEYSYRVVAQRGGTDCASDVQTVKTGLQRNGLPSITVNAQDPNAVYEGFTMACVFGMGFGGGGGGSWSFILDKDGDFVWWYQSSGGGQDCVRSTMSYDGQYMFIANGNVPGPSSGTLVRVKMDGTGEKTYSVPNRHHDVTVLPDGHLGYIEYKDGNSRGCDVVKELDPESGSSTLVYDVIQANPGFSTECHSNAINWWPDQNLFTLSVMYWDSILAFDRQGTLSWKFGGDISTYSGDVQWSRQHQHQLMGDKILLFNNDGQEGNGSSVLEYQMNGNSATRTWTFSSGNSTQSMGDAKRLPNGNTLVTYSNSGLILEVNSAKQTVREIRGNNGTGFGYSTRRSTLYGPPPPYAD